MAETSASALKINTRKKNAEKRELNKERSKPRPFTTSTTKNSMTTINAEENNAQKIPASQRPGMNAMQYKQFQVINNTTGE